MAPVDAVDPPAYLRNSTAYNQGIHETSSILIFSLVPISPHIKCKRPTYPLYFQLISHRHNFFCALVKAELTKFNMSY